MTDDFRKIILEVITNLRNISHNLPITRQNLTINNINAAADYLEVGLNAESTIGKTNSINWELMARAQTRKLHAVLYVPGVKEALKELRWSDEYLDIELSLEEAAQRVLNRTMPDSDNCVRVSDDDIGELRLALNRSKEYKN